MDEKFRFKYNFDHDYKIHYELQICIKIGQKYSCEIYNNLDEKTLQTHLDIIDTDNTKSVYKLRKFFKYSELVSRKKDNEFSAYAPLDDTSDIGRFTFYNREWWEDYGALVFGGYSKEICDKVMKYVINEFDMNLIQKMNTKRECSYNDLNEYIFNNKL